MKRPRTVPEPKDPGGFRAVEGRAGPAPVVCGVLLDPRFPLVSYTLHLGIPGTDVDLFAHWTTSS